MGVFNVFTGVRVLVLGLILGFIFGFIGVFLGMLWLLGFLGGLWILGGYPLHWFTIVYGFLGIFVSGVSSVLHRLFYGGEFSRATGAAIILMGIGTSIYLIGLIQPSLITVYILGLAIILLGSIIYLGYFVSIYKLNNPFFRYGDIFSLIGFIGFPVTIALTLHSIYGDWPTGYMVYMPLLSLYGFPIPIIYGVMTRLIKFKFSPLDLRASMLSLATYIPGLALLYIGLYTGGETPLTLAGIFLTLSALLHIKAVDMMEHEVEEPYRSRMKEGDWRKYIYFTRHLNTAALWLVAATILLALYPTLSTAVEGARRIYLWDMMIHSLTVGFIGNIILAYAGYMLPHLIKRKYAYRSLSLVPYAHLNAGNLLRISGDILRIYGIQEPITMASGLLILAAYIAGIIMIIRLLRE